MRATTLLGALTLALSASCQQGAYIVALEPQDGADEELASRCHEFWYYSVNQAMRCTAREGLYYVCGQPLVSPATDCRTDPSGRAFRIENRFPFELWDAAGWTECSPADDALVRGTLTLGPCGE